MQYGRTTLSKFIIEEQRQTAERDEQLTALINDIQTACKYISTAVARGPLHGAHGSNATHNVQGETQQKLDVIANDIMLRSCEWGGQLAGMSRSSALDFSFFLSIPTMAVATAYDLLKSLRGKGENAIGVLHIDSHGWVILAIGFVVSFIVAYAAVAWFLAWVRKHGFVPFAIYRIVAGLLVLAWAAHMIG